MADDELDLGPNDAEDEPHHGMGEDSRRDQIALEQRIATQTAEASRTRTRLLEIKESGSDGSAALEFDPGPPRADFAVAHQQLLGAAEVMGIHEKAIADVETEIAAARGRGEDTTELQESLDTMKADPEPGRRLAAAVTNEQRVRDMNAAADSYDHQREDKIIELHSRWTNAEQELDKYENQNALLQKAQAKFVEANQTGDPATMAAAQAILDQADAIAVDKGVIRQEVPEFVGFQPDDPQPLPDDDVPPFVPGVLPPDAEPDLVPDQTNPDGPGDDDPGGVIPGVPGANRPDDLSAPSVEVGPAVIEPDSGPPNPDDPGPLAGLGAAGLLGHPEGTPIPASEVPFVNQPQGEVPTGIDSVAGAAAGSGASSADAPDFNIDVGPAVIDPGSDAPPPPDFDIDVGPAVIDPSVPPQPAPPTPAASEGPAAPDDDSPSTFPDIPSVDPSVPGLDPLPPLDGPSADDAFGFDVPVTEEPTFEDTSFEEPAAPEEPAYEAPTYDEPTYDEPTYEASEDEW
ncbi:MAG TPA: hypothetical protein VMZ66_00550 [Aeromicrobium sp.]|nr:hypothetical protein [Aeromicrobium sp.]